MSASTAVLAGLLTRDWRGKRITAFTPSRDIPNCIANIDASVLMGSVGSSVTSLPATHGGFTMNITPATKPTIIASAAAGQNAVRFTTSAYLRNTDFGAGIPGQGTAYAQPLSFAVVLRASADLAIGGNIIIVGGSTVGLKIAPQGLAYYLNAGSDAPVYGPPVNDGNWHVVMGTFAPASNALWLDGYLMSASSTQSHGTGTMGNIYVGPGLGTPLSAGSLDIAQVCWWQTLLTLEQVDSVTAKLAAKWGIS